MKRLYLDVYLGDFSDDEIQAEYESRNLHVEPVCEPLCDYLIENFNGKDFPIEIRHFIEAISGKLMKF